MDRILDDIDIRVTFIEVKVIATLDDAVGVEQSVFPAKLR